MSTIQTQLVLVHLDSGLTAASSLQRTSSESAFTSGAVTVTTTDETVTLGDIVTPQQVILKLISGDDLQVGFEDTNYPMRLSGDGDCCLLRLDKGPYAEVSSISTVADVAWSLGGKWLSLEGNSGTWGVWLDPESDGFSDPTTGMDNSVRVHSFSHDGTAESVALGIYIDLSASTAFMADFNITHNAPSTVVQITDKFSAVRTPIGNTANDTGFAVTTIRTGDPTGASPIVHMKSVGTSQVVVAVAPA